MTDFTAVAAALKAAGIVNAQPSKPTTFLSTGFPPLDKAISNDWNGGIPVKRITEVYGPPSAGKTAIATNAMVSAQRMGGIAIFEDHEHAFDEMQGHSLGLSLEPGQWIYQEPRTYEASLENFQATAGMIRSKKLIPKEAPICVVFDSLASMIPQSALKDFSAMNMNDMTALARVTSQTMKILALLADDYNAAVIFLNQIRTKPGVVYGDPTTTPGGQALGFYASVRIALSASKITVGTGEEAEVVGQQVKAKIIKNKINRPFLTSKWQFRYREDGSGYFDLIGSMIDFLRDQDIIKKEGNFLVWVDGTKYHRAAMVKRVIADGGLPVLMAMLPAGVELTPEPEDSAEEAA